MRALVVGTEPLIEPLLKEVLTPLGYKLRFSTNSAEAAALCRNERWALLCLSASLGGKVRGVIREARALEEKCPLILAVWLPDHSSETELTWQADADDLLSLPSTPAQIAVRLSFARRKKVIRSIESEAALQGEEPYRLFVSQSSEGICRFDTTRGVAINRTADKQVLHFYQRAYLGECNDAMAKMYGFEKASEIVGARLAELHPPFDPGNLQLIRTFVTSGHALNDYETQESDRNGKERYFLNNLVGIIKDGYLTGLWGTRRDITRLKETEEALRKSEETLRDLIENARDLIYTVDLEGKFTSVNQAVREITGYSKKDVLGKTLFDFLTPDFADRIRDSFSQQLKCRVATLTYEISILSKEGRRLNLETSSRLLTDHGAPTGIQGIARDITERKRLEEQLRHSQKMEAVGQLAGGIAHDFNNLLTAINGYSQLLSNSLKDDPRSKEVNQIVKAGQRASALTEKLLAFSRKKVLQPRVFDLNQVIRDMKEMLRRLISENIELHTSLRAFRGKVSADPDQISQVVMNLVLNARDAMPEGGKLTIETGNTTTLLKSSEDSTPSEKGCIMLAVRDTGIGMNEEVLSHMFEPFYTTKPPGKGTGLGLAMTYGIVRQSGGEIRVESQPGKGSVFRVCLPVAEQTVADDFASDPAAVTGGAETILLVEDERLVRRLIRQILVSHGYQVLEASDPLKALEICQNHRDTIHATVTDVVMPFMNGWELGNRLADLRPGIKLLYMSGYTDDAVVRNALQCSDNFLQKPFPPDVLLNKLRMVLDQDD
jgi:two-component system, cell cycle sensor histidine kinase and response regulator CckA